VSEWIGLLRSLVVYWRPGRQRGLRRLYGTLVHDGDLVFDVGAHLGDRAAAFAALGARVVAIEPQPRIARWLQRIVGNNERIVVREAAVGARVGRERLAISRRTPTVSTLSESWRTRALVRSGGRSRSRSPW
jgi:FkbM family methyltransferase